MELNLKLQRSEEAQLNRLFNRHLKRQNRRHIVEERIAVRKAYKDACVEQQNYYSHNKLTVKQSALSRKYRQSKIKKFFDKALYTLKKKIYSAESIYLYVYYSFLDTYEALRKRRAIFASLAMLLFLSVAGAVAYNHFFGYEVTFNGYNIGIVRNMDVLETALKNADAKLAQWYKNDTIYYEKSITTKRSFINDSDKVLDAKTCEEAIYICNIPVFADGGVITIDGIEAVKLSSVSDAQAALDLIKANSDLPKTALNEIIIENDVKEEIQVVEKIVDLTNIKTVDEAAAYLMTLNSQTSGRNKNNSIASTSPTSVTTLGDSENENSIEDFVFSVKNDSGNKGLMTALNFRKDEFSIGEVTTKPTLTITTVKEVTYEAPVPYSSTYKQDSSLYYGSTKVISKGVNGIKKVTDVITYVNGKEQSRTLKSEVVTKSPVNEVVAKGTKALPPAVSTGTFIIPTSGTVSSLVRNDSNSHREGRAVDISNSYGTNIIASDSGVVTMAEFYGDYGKTVMIKHENGYSTLYAHLSKYEVKVGDQVDQGQVIAKMGSTGRSTGSHLHFEIRYKDARQKIRSYFSNIVVGVKVTAGK